MTKKILGIIGGGQLGRMLTTAALELNISVTVVDPAENPPAVQVGANHIRAGLSDERALEKLMSQCDVVTWEIEHISTDSIRAAMSSDNSIAKVEPSVDTLEMIQDKLTQKNKLVENSIDVPKFSKIDSEEDIKKFFDSCPNGAIIKTRRGGFDGRGNFVVRSDQDIQAAINEFGIDGIYIEELQDLSSEVSVIVARGTTGEMKSYDPVDMIHEDNICHLISAPTKVDTTTESKCIELANKVVPLLEGAGMFAIEMFVTNNNEVLVNEIAPRVHNSGHHSIEACHTSQFEQHVRAVMGMPLGDPKLCVSSTVMVNLLGTELSDSDELKGIEKALDLGAHFHWYGKSPIKPARKMGHMTFISKDNESIEEVEARATEAREAVEI